MTPLTWAAFAVFAIAAVADWWSVATSRLAVEKVAKPLATASLVVAAVFIDADVPGLTHWAFVAALALALLGDMLLLPPRRFLLGLVAFQLGHVGFIVGLVALPTRMSFLLAGSVIVALTTAYVARPIMAGVVNGPHADMREAVGAYILVIALMTVLAWSGGIPAMAAGATLFLFSDTILAWREFVAPKPWMNVAVMVTYHCGLALLVVGLLG